MIVERWKICFFCVCNLSELNGAPISKAASQGSSIRSWTFFYTTTTTWNRKLPGTQLARAVSRSKSWSKWLMKRSLSRPKQEESSPSCWRGECNPITNCVWLLGRDWIRRRPPKNQHGVDYFEKWHKWVTLQLWRHIDGCVQMCGLYLATAGSVKWWDQVASRQSPAPPDSFHPHLGWCIWHSLDGKVWTFLALLHIQP